MYCHEKHIDIDHISAEDISGIELDFHADYSVFINGQEYTQKIRTPQAGQDASKISTQMFVRDFVQNTLREKLRT